MRVRVAWRAVRVVGRRRTFEPDPCELCAVASVLSVAVVCAGCAPRECGVCAVSALLFQKISPQDGNSIVPRVTDALPLWVLDAPEGC